MLGNELLLLVPQSLAMLERCLPWLATYALHSTVLILGAVLVTSRHFPWRPGVGVRDVLWKCAIVGGFVTATVQPLVGRAAVGGRWSLGQRASVGMQEVHVIVSSDSASHPRIETTRQTTMLPLPGTNVALFATASRDAVWRAALALFWLAVVLIVVLRHDLALARLGRLLSSRRQALHTPAAAILRHLAARAGVARPVYLTVSEALCSPAAIDGHEICVPPRFLTDINLFEQESILAHELAHLVRRDVLWLRIVNLVTAVCFFQPLNRLARGRWQANAEFAADDWAVRLTGQPLQLARGLASVASWVSDDTAHVALPAMAATDRSVLVQRVRRLTGEQRPAVTNSGWVTAAAVAAVGALVVVAPRFDMPANHTRDIVRRIAWEERVAQTGSSGITRQVRVVQLTGSTDEGPGRGSQALPAVIHRQWLTDTTAQGKVILVLRKPAIPIRN